MPTGNDLFALPAGPAEICFDTNEFMKKTFSVDDFLHEHRNAASLETMRDDLGIYLKVLRTAMIDLINEDYADFVNLSSNLVGLDQSIEAIKMPLEQLRDEVLNVKQTINDNMTEIRECLDEKKRLREYKKILKSLGKVQKSISKLTDLLENQLEDLSGDIKPVILERAALELVQLQFHAKVCSELLNETQAEKTSSLHKQLLEKLRDYFLDTLKSSSADRLERCLRIYATIDEYQAAEAVFRDDIVGPYMDKRISENTLQNSAQGLIGIYNQILDFISLHMKDLLLLTHHTDKVKGFGFLVNSFWQEVERRLETHLASIFAPGNPESFYVKYKCTLDFLANVETILGTDAAVQEFRDHPQYKSFQSRWNLPVYFQIRFQEIAGQVELACDELLPAETAINKDSKELKCIVFQTALQSIMKSWSDGVYLQQLFVKFWKFTMQIIGRTVSWTELSVKEIEKSTEPNLDKARLLIVLYADIRRFMEHFPSIVQVAIDNAPVQVQDQHALLTECIDESRNQLNTQLASIETVLIKEIVTKSSRNIRQVSDIPRLYRKTNREVPNKHCAYAELMIEPFNSFRNEFQENIGAAKIEQLFATGFSKISVQYFKAIEEVLTSVQKTEESLRRLKNLRERSGAAATTSTTTADRQGMSDDDKIRLQLQIDVRFWTQEIERNGVKRNDVERLNDMIGLVEDTAKTNRTTTSTTTSGDK